MRPRQLIWWSVGLSERLLTPGSIPERAVRRCVLGKDTSPNIPLGPSSSPVLVTQPNKKLANTKTGCLLLCNAHDLRPVYSVRKFESVRLFQTENLVYFKQKFSASTYRRTSV